MFELKPTVWAIRSAQIVDVAISVPPLKYAVNKKDVPTQDIPLSRSKRLSLSISQTAMLVSYGSRCGVLMFWKISRYAPKGTALMFGEHPAPTGALAKKLRSGIRSPVILSLRLEHTTVEWGKSLRCISATVQVLSGVG